MSIHNYSIHEADVVIVKPSGEKLSFFDVSPTIECRWIAIDSRDSWLLTTFGSTREMLEFIAHEQIKGGIVTCYTETFLDSQANGDGFDTWGEYVEYVRVENYATS